jgi:hypothetical protein
MIGGKAARVLQLHVLKHAPVGPQNAVASRSDDLALSLLSPGLSVAKATTLPEVQEQVLQAVGGNCCCNFNIPALPRGGQIDI